MSAAQPRDRVARLRTEGAAQFDSIGLEFIESLLSRAEKENGGARERLLARAAARVDLFEAAFHQARVSASRAIAQLAEASGEAPAELEEALARGDAKAAQRGAERKLAAFAMGARPVRLPHLARLARAALDRDLVPIADMARELASLAGEDGALPRRSKRRALLLGSALSRALFRESLERARAPLAVARARDNVPEAAGPYNPQALAARALGALDELSPAYAQALVAALDDLASLAAALEPAPRKVKGSRRRRTGAAAP